MHIARFVAATLAASFVLTGPAFSQTPPGVRAVQGPVDGMDMMSDEYIWREFVKFTAPFTPGERSPVIFETWASDHDTFNENPVWPDPGADKKLQVSLQSTDGHGGLQPIDVACSPPPGAATGNFPATGCIAEETKRNRPQWDFITGNGYNTGPGRAAAFDKVNIQMPTTAISVKGDWTPVKDLMAWLPDLESEEQVRALYYTDVSGGTEYALLSLHVSTKQNPNWVWGSFEHEMNPGRCDFIGCADSFGAVVPMVEPNRADMNGGYGTCEKTDAVLALFEEAGLDEVWQHYCMKGTMTDYTAEDGTPYVLGNSVIEGITGNGTVAASSCIACHVYASFDSSGYVAPAAGNMLPYNPTGRPLEQPLLGSNKFDFMWGVITQPKPAN
ncbi:hypothetical protein [Roseovarius aestuariivivens]|uniref:hypothetical protein n=1 Tax=Roseovarius aestuariivivens TaxID=1888910 RepID=UPI00108106F7|nr:hypothetical protein [Roseovarius aestuariivivens]